MKTKLPFLTILILLVLTANYVSAQYEFAFDRFQFHPELNYDAQITSPADYLGYELGEEYTFHHQVMDYFKQLDEESDKLSFHKYATTYEGRDLYYAVISSEENQGNIESIREANLELANNPESSEMEDNPVVVWLSYNVHGNEPSSSEAAMQTAYRLVAANDSETQNWLDNAVVIIDPMINPDGRDRYVYWYKSSRANILNTNADDLEHDEIWPGGRTNHYWFDLNRDWVWLVHPESQGRIEVYQQWMPQVHMDFHEQGFNNNYFAMPGTTPRNLELPAEYEEWADTFGRGLIEEFDKAGVNYATRESFDFYYPGYGSSYPSVMGGIGMLAEQGGHSRGGRAVETEDGYVLTLRQRIFDHYTNGVSIVKTSVENKAGLLNYFKQSLSQSAQKGDTRAYILPNNENDYTYQVINMLMKHGVEVEQATEDFSQRNAFSYWDGSSSNRDFGAGDFIIKTDQPRHLFINTLFRKQMNIEDSVMYDMSTWSVPMAYNLDAAWTTRDVSVDTEPVTEDLMYASELKDAGAQYAYVIDWDQRHAPKALAKLWDMEYKVRSARRAFTSQGKTYSEGSLIVLVGRNYEKKNQMEGDMQKIAESAKVVVEGFDTGRMDEGMDLASSDSQPIEKPNVALMIDSPFSSYTAGQLWFLFDQWTEFGINRIRSGSFSTGDLDEYDVILMPGAWRGVQGVWSENDIEALKDWVRQGGILIGAEASGAWLTKNESGFTDVELFEEDEADTTDIDPKAYTKYADREDVFGLERIPGSAFKGIIDNTNPLAFGLPERMYSLKFNDDGLVPSTSYQTVGYYVKDSDEVLASGYASQENKEKAAGMAFAGVESMGSGKVVFLLDNTQYRMFWVGPSRMVQNAVMLLPGM
ncbi:M14 family metallopeptidase [Gracilimonas mengyeensis]|uniref:Zinc carboxypeptidase n=1 Tax=Gracilimonas mengyeensis TaxID=1302730 RepID=A0A521EEB5_9BACT|nr:M14 family metallopeptidase [Gracilimonas mengyeensis]SMO82267.1 Zinc carboxypeptidase [Gracilimonas mengyeensis]